MHLQARTPHDFAVSALFLIFLTVTGHSVAEETPTLETLVVTAHRIPLSESEVGSSVSTLDRDLIDTRQIVLASRLLQDVAGIAVSRAGGAGAQTQVRVRGAEANHVLVLVDGVKANDPAGSDEFDFSSLTAHDIERIEVVRGPQSALWGSEATAGVINITTRGADERLGVSGFLEGGSRETLYTGARISSGGARGGFAFNGSYADTQGESAALTGTENDGYKNLSLGLNGNWQPSDTSRLAVSGRYSDVRAEYDGMDFETGLPADADLVSENELLMLKGEGGVSTLEDRWDHNLRLTYLDSDRQQFRDGEWESGTAASKLGLYYQSTVSLEPAKQNLIVGIDYEQEDFEQRGFVGYNDPNQDQRRDNVGWVAEYLATPTEGLNLSGSLRYDDNSDFEDVTTYRLTSSYLLAQTRLRASYGTGQKRPTFTELYGFFPDTFIGNPALRPERSRGFDVGITQSLFSDRWQANAAYFNERLEDEIVTGFDPDTFFSTPDNLDEKSHRQGVEVEVSGRLNANFELLASYTYTDSKQPDDVREVRRPRHMAAGNVHYAWLDGRGGLNLNLSYTGSQTDQVFLPPLFAPETVNLSDYLLVDLAASYAFSDRVEVYVRANNLFDEDYVNVVGYSSPGRSLHLGVRIGR